MKVCFIAGTLGRGGAERQLLYMLKALQMAGIEPRVLCLTKGESYEADITALGIEVEYIGKQPNRLIRSWKIIDNLRKRRVDIVQSSHFYTNIYVGLAGRLLGIRSVGAIRSNFLTEMQDHGFLGRFQVSLPGFLVVNSDQARRRAVDWGIDPQRVEFVRNVVEVSPNNRHSNSDERSGVTLLFVGRLTKEKRADRFVRIADILAKERHPGPLRFVVAGDGPLRPEIERHVISCDSLRSKLEFLGQCASMEEVYRNADILVLTSEYEGTPNVILEAMAHSLPVIATSVGGVSEILDDSRGILVDSGDEASLVNAARELIHNPALREKMGRAGREYVDQNHSLERLGNQLISLYQRIGATPATRTLQSV